MARLGTRLLTLSIGGTDYTAQVSNVEVNSAAADSDFVTFADAASGGARQYTLKFTCEQNLDATTALWRKIWDAAGTTVAFIIKPYGNATASATQLFVTGNAVISEPDGTLLGGDANASTTAAFTTDVEWNCTAKPTFVTS